MNISELITSGKVTRLTHDSRETDPRALFFAIEGSTRDGHEFVANVLGRNHAQAAVVRKSHPITTALLKDNAIGPRLIPVDDTRVALAEAAALIYGEPSKKMLVCGVTGTNGKTTSTYLLEALLAEWGQKPAVIGTVENRFEGFRIPSSHTTPDPIGLQLMLRDFHEKGATAIAMEVSSHALDQRRTHAMHFAAALFTNLTQDHLDYHGTLENYFAAKTLLFTDYPVKTRAIHADDPYGKKLIDLCKAKGLDVITYGRSGCDVNYGELQISSQGITGALKLRSGRKIKIRSPLIGAFNAQNLSGAVAVALGLGIPDEKISSALAHAKQVPGRMESVPNKRGLTVVVDYAHTPDALENVLKTLCDLHPKKLLCVFGCGGDRDAAKRPLMAEIAERLSDEIFVTSDNPRTENPEAILDDIFKGLKQPARAHRIADRREAIAQSVARLKAGEILLIAGKGHEDYQIIGTQKLPFDDRKVAQENMER